jgi:nucleoside-diphosphate-sugar epimerase
MKLLVTGGSGFIGTNLIDSMIGKGEVDLINVDKRPPPKPLHMPYWKECNILECSRLQGIFDEYRPTHVIHLAARTDTDSDELEDYKDNTEGTANVLQAIKSTGSVKRVIITSSQFVFGPGNLPKSDEEFKPVGAYGQSKVITENLTRSANLNCIWTIIRPTNVWGPWHPRYPREFWHVLKRGLYVHPGRMSVVRSYGYVGNIVYQIEKILELPAPIVNGKVFYLGDRPIELLNWVNGFSRAIAHKDVIIAPTWVVRSLAYGGDLLSLMGIRFPIRTSRYRSMTQDYLTPMEPTFESFGDPPYSLAEGIKITADWLKMYWNGDFS